MPRSSTQPPNSVQDAAERLIAGAPGILLIGSPVQTSTALGDLLAHTRATLGNRLQPVRFPAATGTPALLRDVVGRAYEARPDAATRLLIVVAQADALSLEALQEFEIAAEAASVHGGLQFLFTSIDDLSLAWKSHHLVNLYASLKHPLHLVAETDEPGLLATYGSLDGPEGPETWPDETPRRGLRVRIMVVILSIVAVVALVALVVIGIAYERHVPLLSLLPSGARLERFGLSPAVQERAVQAPGARTRLAPSPSTEPPASRTVASPSRRVMVQPTVTPPTATPAVQPAIRLSTPAPGAPFAAAPVASITATEIAPPAPTTVVVPGASLLLIAEPGDTLPKLYAKVYRGMTPPPYSEVTAVNPATIKPGDHLMFPTPPNGWRP
ncbi:MAG: hypothetical protein ACRYFY_07800 [Janthinobacterium lividum]